MNAGRVNDPVRISILPDKDEKSGGWFVQVMVTGLQSESQALAAADHITALLCGPEIAEN